MKRNTIQRSYFWYRHYFMTATSLNAGRLARYPNMLSVTVPPDIKVELISPDWSKYQTFFLNVYLANNAHYSTVWSIDRPLNGHTENKHQSFALPAVWAGEKHPAWHYNDVIMSVMAPQNTSLAIVYSTVYSGAD